MNRLLCIRRRELKKITVICDRYAAKLRAAGKSDDAIASDLGWRRLTDKMRRIKRRLRLINVIVPPKYGLLKSKPHLTSTLAINTIANRSGVPDIGTACEAPSRQGIDAINRERHALIKKKNRNGLSASEESRLETLQQQAAIIADQLAPLDTSLSDRVDELLAKFGKVPS